MIYSQGHFLAHLVNISSPSTSGPSHEYTVKKIKIKIHVMGSVNWKQTENATTNITPAVHRWRLSAM